MIGVAGQFAVNSRKNRERDQSDDALPFLWFFFSANFRFQIRAHRA
jgi:hypothetical protein